MDLDEPDLDRRERLTRDYILPLLPQEYGSPNIQDEANLRAINSILAKQYVKHASLGPFWKTGMILIAYDWLFLLDSQVYGLVLSALGSLTLALPNFYTPELLAEEATEKSDNIAQKIESGAKLSVKTNIGVVGLTVGFVWQVLAISGPLAQELLSQNWLQGNIQNWVGFALIFFAGMFIMGKGKYTLRGVA
jgi:hypothetical protein